MKKLFNFSKDVLFIFWLQLFLIILMNEMGERYSPPTHLFGSNLIDNSSGNFFRIVYLVAVGKFCSLLVVSIINGTNFLS